MNYTVTMEGERQMENEFEEEIEALGTLKEYNVKVVKALKEVIPELKGEKKEDTDEYFQHILKGINWEIQVINGTMDYLNKEEETISKEKVNGIIVDLNDAIKEKQDLKIVSILESQMVPFLISLSEIIETVL